MQICNLTLSNGEERIELRGWLDEDDHIICDLFYLHKVQQGTHYEIIPDGHKRWSGNYDTLIAEIGYHYSRLFDVEVDDGQHESTAVY